MTRFQRLPTSLARNLTPYLDIAGSLAGALRSALKPRAELLAENLALRHQVAVLKQKTGRFQLSNVDRAFWLGLSKHWGGWRDAIFLVKPDTVVAWHRKGFKAFWAWQSRNRRPGPGRPKIDQEIRTLIRKMTLENLTWGSPKIHGELLKLGFDISEPTVWSYMRCIKRPPSQTWRTFLDNHASDTAACDFFTVHTAGFKLLYVFIVISHDRRLIRHVAVAAAPDSDWTSRQVVQVFDGFDDDSLPPKYLFRDRDSIFGEEFRKHVLGLGIKQVVSARRSPWQNPYVERVIGSIRRECLNHCIAINEAHLRRILREYVVYYNATRTHLSLGKDCPIPRPADPPENGAKIVSIPVLGGLHHRYERRAA